ncbi:MAG: prolyl oligopeptidase family serine peptidase [Thermoguttaceae bacterium]
MPLKNKFLRLSWIDGLLLLAIAGLSIGLLAMLLEPVVKAWKNRPRPGMQVPQQCLVKQGTDASATQIPVDYLLYLPQKVKERDKWPLVVYLHGSGARGHNLELVQREWLPQQTAHGEQFPFILASPQCPTGLSWSPELIVEWVEQVSRSFPVDRDRVYLTGYSMGGFGTWATAIHDPGRFAAIAPLCGGGDIERVDRLKNTPIWAFHGGKDKTVPPKASQNTVDAVRKCGGHPQLTIFPDAGHGICRRTYQNKGFWEWLLEQRRSLN